MIWKYLIKGFSSPLKAYNRLSALLKGLWYIIYFRVTKKDVVICFPFWVYGKVHISGPGKVFIDNGCETSWSSFYHLNIITLNENAKVIIGKRCGLSGVTIRCAGEVIIRDHTGLAATLIQDVAIVSQYGSEDVPKQKSFIAIGNNVWLASQVIVLANSIVGDDSVIGTNGLIYNFEVPSKCLAVANPIQRCLPIAFIKRLEGNTI